MTDLNDKLEFALSVQKQMHKETRQELSEAQNLLVETQRQLQVSRIKVENLAKRLGDMPEMIDKKDREIEMLQKRLANLNSEYNSINRGKVPIGTAIIGEDQELLKRAKRGAITLADVKKITGEQLEF